MSSSPLTPSRPLFRSEPSPQAPSAEPGGRPRATVTEMTLRPKVQLKAPSPLADHGFRILIFACAMSVLLIVGLIVSELILHSQLSIDAFGWRFFTAQTWDPVSGDFGALPFIYGTVVSSLLALVLALPLGVGVAVFTTEMCPKVLRGQIGRAHV